MRQLRIGVRLLRGIAWFVGAVAISANAQTFDVLYNFGSNSGDPSQPSITGILAQGEDGNLYSTSPTGGANGIGTVFKITPAGTLTVLYNFDGTHGQAPYSGLTLGKDGNFYGTTSAGGANGYGTIFKVTPAGVLTTLHSFTNTDGASPHAPPIQGMDGNFYGTTLAGGSSAAGTVYKISSGGTFKVFAQISYSVGYQSYAPLVQGTDGNFYGSLWDGGSGNAGSLFEVSSTGKFTAFHEFDISDGNGPYAPLIQGADGNFYGTTVGGGNNGTCRTACGVIFNITPSGTLTDLYVSNDSTDGWWFESGLVQASDGNFYGVAYDGGTGYGTIYEWTSGGIFSVLQSFDLTDGANPGVTPTQHTNGILYGETYQGGTGSVSPCTAGSCGVIYSLNNSLPPFVQLVTRSGKVGTKIGLLGQGFSASSVVEFAGVKSLKVTPTGTTYLAATVPVGATTGSVTVSTNSGTLTSNTIFLVTPKITSFAPPNGPVGTSVTITGVSLTQTTSVTFDGVPATSFTINSDTQVTAIVPTGAKTGKIGIVTLGGTATSTSIFTVT